MGLGRLVGLRTEVRGGRPGLGEEAREHRLDEGTENNLSATVITAVSHVLRYLDGMLQRNIPSLGESHPQDEDELEGVVKGC
jgi:hypothetical protein